MALRQDLESNENIAWYEFRDDKVVVVFKDGSTYMHTGGHEGGAGRAFDRIAAAASKGRDFLRMDKQVSK